MVEPDLIVIEAPGKLGSVYRCFDRMGRPITAVATLGHIYKNQGPLDRAGMAWVDGALVETDRVPERPDALAHLRAALARCTGRVVIATDDDTEGHVIAQDVAQLAVDVGVAGPVVRVLPHAMTPEAWREAMDAARPLDPEDARVGTARRLLDRLIAFVSIQTTGGRPVGRVQSALLGLGGTDQVPDRAVCVPAPAADGGTPFMGVGGFHGPIPSEALAPVPVATTSTEPLGELMHGGDALLALQAQLGLPIGEASALLQSMYEAGEISYPRASGRGLRADGAAAVAMLARARAVRSFSAQLLPLLAPNTGPAHESVHLVLGGMIERLDLGKPLRLCADTREAAATVIGRRCIEAGVPVARDRPVLGALPPWARKLDWSRDHRRPSLPWRSSTPPVEQSLDLATGIVRAQLATGLGRPSTWARHAERCADSDWFAPGHGLSIVGRIQLSGVLTPLRDPATSVAIERVLEDVSLSVHERVEEALVLVLGNDRAAAHNVLQELADACPNEVPIFSL